MAELATLAAQFGFPAVMAVVVFYAYWRQTERIIKVVETNTAAHEGNRAAQTATQKVLVEVIRRLEAVERRMEPQDERS